jgi:ankyrin repeat protein
VCRPLHDAAAKGDVNELKRLIHNVDEEKEEKQDPDERDSAQNTALHWAAGAGRDDAVRFLLDSGCDINAINLLGDTALHRAVWRDQYSTVQLLVHRGIDRSVVNRQGHRAIHLVRNVEIGAFLQRFDPLSDNDDDDEDNDGRNPNEEGDSTVDREAGSPLATTTTSSGDGMTLGAYLNHLQMLGSSDDSATSSFLSRYQLDGYSDDDDDDDDENGSEEDDNIDG